MFSDNSSALLALGVLLIAVLSVVALWLWWSSGREEDEDEDGEEVASPDSRSAPPNYPSLDEPLQGSFIERLRESLKPLIPNRGTTLPSRSAPNPPVYVSSASQTHDAEAVEVVRVLRDLADGSLMVEVGGVRYRSMEQVVDQTIARRLIGNAQEFAQFVGMDTTGDVIAPPPSFIPSAPPTPGPASREPDVIVPALAPEEEPSQESVADAINDILQMRLAASEEFSGRSIYIDDSPDGGVMIQIDGVRYEAVADITEEPVREFIQTIIREWESQQ